MLLAPTRPALGWAVAVWIGLVAACDGSVVGSSSAPGDAATSVPPPPSAAPVVCTTAREYFAREVWSRVLGQSCVQCHGPGGVASEQNAALQLLPATYPGFLDANFENASMVAKFSFDGRPVLLQKPLGMMSHGGGAPLREDSEEFRILSSFVGGVGAPETCLQSGSATAPDELVLLDPDATFRKAALQLADRLPSDDERAQLQREGEAALAPLLDGLMTEDAFIARVVELYNDELLTDFYLRFVGAAVNLLSDQDYPGAGMVYGELDEEARARANLGIAREPLSIIAHVVREELPFSEILTADYTMVNAGSAGVYSVDPGAADATDPQSFVPAHVSALREDGSVPIPHAGLLTTPAFLNRFPTSGTNRNRHRARKVYDFFLATDILKAGDRPIDPSASTRFNNPTRDDAQCNACHRQLDPIAGAFMKWDEGDQERYRPDRDWYPEMFAPGFGREVMETSEYMRALPWLAQRIVADPRFVLSTIYTVYRGLTGQNPLPYPRDDNDAEFDAQLAAWQRQDASFQRIGRRFVDEGMRFKTVVSELVLSAEFRAINARPDVSEPAIAALSAMGSGRLSSPERLAAKIEAVTGMRWARDGSSDDYLRNDFQILYGGIDSDTVVHRLTQLNGTMASVAARMANEVSCKATSLDFSKPRGDRLLFGEVEPGDVPEAAPKMARPAADSVERIRRNLQHLHDRVLGEKLEPGDPEIDRSFALFVETWREGAAAKSASDAEMKGGNTDNLPSPCRARVDPETGMDLPEGARVESDPNHTIRAWMAVLTYLLSDYRFLYEP